MPPAQVPWRRCVGGGGERGSRRRAARAKAGFPRGAARPPAPTVRGCVPVAWSGLTAHPSHCPSESRPIRVTAHPSHGPSESRPIRVTAHPSHDPSESRPIRVTAHPGHGPSDTAARPAQVPLVSVSFQCHALLRRAAQPQSAHSPPRQRRPARHATAPKTGQRLVKDWSMTGQRLVNDWSNTVRRATDPARTQPGPRRIRRQAG